MKLNKANLSYSISLLITSHNLNQSLTTFTLFIYLTVTSQLYSLINNIIKVLFYKIYMNNFFVNNSEIHKKVNVFHKNTLYVVIWINFFGIKKYI